MLKFGAEEVLFRIGNARHFRFEIVGLEVSTLKVVTQARQVVMSSVALNNYSETYCGYGFGDASSGTTATRSTTPIVLPSV